MAIDPKELEFNKNEDEMRQKISKMEQELAKIFKGGGEKRIAALHEKGKMTARERIDMLFGSEYPAVRSRCFCRLWHVQRARWLSVRWCRCRDRLRFKKAVYRGS